LILVDTNVLLDDVEGATVTKSAKLTVQRWGNSLAVRIPAAVARSARFRVGQPVEVSVQDSNVHSGEAMATVPVGKEIA